MEVKPGYKQTEVGVIPEDWEVGTATDACDLVVDCKNRTPPVVPDSDFAVVRTPNVRNGRFVLDELRFTDEESYRVWTARAVPQLGDILITREAPLGEVCAVPPNRKVCLGQRMMLYRPAPERTSSTYLLYSLMSEPVRENLFRKIGGSTVGHAKVDDIRFLQLPLPPLPEQRAIAAALGDVDGLLGGLDRLIAKKRDLKQAAMQQLLTGQTRLPGFHAEWEVKRLGDVVRITKGQLITEGNAIPGPIPVIAGGKQPAYFHNKPNRTGKTVTISASGASAGYVAFFAEPIFASDCSTISESEGYSIEFVYFQLQLKQATIYKAQTGGAQPHIHATDVNPIEVFWPTVPEQSAIAEVLTDMDAELAALEQRREKTRALKQAMMQELLTGRTRLLSPAAGAKTQAAR